MAKKKIGVNEPCPCGSGKKYKKCCFNTQDRNNKIITNEIETQTDDFMFHNEEDEFLSDEDMKFMFQKLMVEAQTDLLSRNKDIILYRKIRTLHNEVLSDMYEHFEDCFFTQLLKVCERYPGINFDINTKLGLNAYYDVLVYKAKPNIVCLSEEFININRYKDKERIEFLHSLLDSKLGLYEVLKTNIENGHVLIKNIFTEKEHDIIDIALSTTTSYNNAYLYMRIIEHKGISFNSGMTLFFKKNDKFIKDHIREHKENFDPNTEYARFVKLYNKYIQNEGDFKVIMNEFKD